MADTSIQRQIDLKTSRSGRLLVPRLKCWTGERIFVNKKGVVEIVDSASPDCTATFQTDSFLFRHSASFINLSQSYNIPKASKSPKARVAKRMSESPLSSMKQKRTKLKDLELPNKSPTSLRKSVHSREIQASEKVTQKVATPVKALPNGKQLQSNSNFGKKVVDSPKKSPMKINSPKKSPRKIDSPTKSSRKIDSSIKSPRKIDPPKRSPRKNNLKTVVEPPSVNIYGPEFQPVVVLRRLNIEEITQLTARKPDVDKKIDSRAKSPKRQKQKALSKPKKNPKPKQPAKAPATDSVKPFTGGRPRTVRETQNMLRVLNRPKADNIEDEAESTAAFFQNTPGRRALKQIAEANDILHDDFGESDDNLSIRTISERESSPVSSAVSPIGSIHDTEAENSVFEDGLMRGSPIVNDPTSFQRARLLHRTIKDRAKLLKLSAKANKKVKEIDGENPENCSIPPAQALGTQSSVQSSQFLQTHTMRAFEKNLTKKIKSSEPFDFSAMYKGNVLHVSINSESDESSVDSLDEF